MILTLQQQVEILKAGGGMAIDASAYTFNQLMDLADAAQTIPTTLVLRQVGWLTADQLMKLATANPGKLLFDFAVPVASPKSPTSGTTPGQA